MINKEVLAKLDHYRAAFLTATPFKHVVIDNFFETDKAEQLLRDFPSFDKNKALNELGEIGGKAVFENITDISPFYQNLFTYVKSTPFLRAVSDLTGIEDLQNDDSMYGGGTHENLHGQELDSHVDFNYDPKTGLHRRLNLLLYLNKEWEESWGGSIELHSNPRNPAEDQIISVLPIFNRCVLFETNEYSWHGFPKIQLPKDRRHLSRKSFSLYLYTKDRPAAEVAPPHATFYVQRPLPEHIKPGLTLSPADFQTIRDALKKRDKMIEFYQNKELHHGRIHKELVAHLAEVESAIRLPLTGYGLQQGTAKGFWPDGWVAREMEVAIRAEQDIYNVQVFGYLPKYMTTGNEITVSANTFSETFTVAPDESFQISVPVEFTAGSIINLFIKSNQSMSGQRAGINEDKREGAFLLTQMRLD